MDETCAGKGAGMTTYAPVHSRGRENFHVLSLIQFTTHCTEIHGELPVGD